MILKKDNLTRGDKFTRRELRIPDSHNVWKWQTNKLMFERDENDIWEFKKEL